MAPDCVELHSWEWERGKASHPVYLERARIFHRFRFSLRIRFLRHFALMIKLREGLHKEGVGLRWCIMLGA